MPKITKKEIWDKSKADRLVMTIAGSQVFWLVAPVVARGIQHLPVTLLELFTMALITRTGATTFFLVSKDSGVETTTDDQHSAHLTARWRWGRSTLSRHSFGLHWASAIYVGAITIAPILGVQERPLPCIPNDRDPRLHSLNMILVITVPTAAFLLLHLILHKIFKFLTKAELLLWRWTCVSLSAVLGKCYVTEAASIAVEDYITAGLTTPKEYKLRWPTNLLLFVPGSL